MAEAKARKLVEQEEVQCQKAACLAKQATKAVEKARRATEREKN